MACARRDRSRLKIKYGVQWTTKVHSTLQAAATARRHLANAVYLDGSRTTCLRIPNTLAVDFHNSRTPVCRAENPRYTVPAIPGRRDAPLARGLYCIRNVQVQDNDSTYSTAHLSLCDVL